MRRELFYTAQSVLAFFILFASSELAIAKETLKLDLSRHGDVIKAAFKEVVEQSKHFVVEVEINREKVCLGTLIQYATKEKDGLIVCKASLLGEFVSKTDKFRCHDSDKIWREVIFLGFDTELDTVFLKLKFSEEKDLQQRKKLIQAKKSQPGQWLVSLGYQKELPLGIGVLGAEPRMINSSRGFAGLNVDETDNGLAITKVLANSGASRAGFQAGDRLMESEEKIAKKRKWLSKLLKKYEPGDWLPILAKRGEEVMMIDLQIGTSWQNMLERQAMMNRFGSAISERRTGFRSVLQHDTLLHPKDCGSPIVNLKGEIVGVNIARAGRTDTFAVPIQEILDTAEKFAPKKEKK